MGTTALELKESPATTYLIPTRTGNAKVATQVMELKEIQRGLLSDFRENQGKPAVRALLARTYTIVAECLRVARGIPSPGQLRPDLDPVQMARMLKRARKRQPIDLPSDIKAALKTSKGKAWSDEPTDNASPNASSEEQLPHDPTPTKTSVTKESLIP